jgi:hypothetical protein
MLRTACKGPDHGEKILFEREELFSPLVLLGIKGDDAKTCRWIDLLSYKNFLQLASLPQEPSLRLLVAIPGQSFELKGWLIFNVSGSAMKKRV